MNKNFFDKKNIYLYYINYDILGEKFHLNDELNIGWEDQNERKTNEKIIIDFIIWPFNY